MLSIQKFGFELLADRDLGSGRRRVRRAAVHLGHALLVDPRAADRDADRARHRRSSSPSCARLRCGSRWCSSPSCSPRFRRSSTACGASSCWCRPCARSRSAMPDVAAAAAALQRPAARRRHAVGGADPRDHGHPVHLVGRARGAQVGAGGAARRRLRARRDALRGDPRRALLRAHRHRRRGHARLRPRARRDDGGDDGDRQQPAGVRCRCSRRSTRWRRCIANEFTEAADELYLHALVEIGLVLFIITLIVNSLSRLLIWSMARQRPGPRGRRAAAPAGGGRMSRTTCAQGRCRRCSSASARCRCCSRWCRWRSSCSSSSARASSRSTSSSSRTCRSRSAKPGGGMANAIVGTLILTGLGSLIAVPIGVLSGIYMSEYAGTRFASAGPVRRRHAERRAVDRHRRVRLRHRGAAVQAVQRAGRRLRARHHDDSDHRADDRGAAAARAGHDARRRAGARRDAGARGVHASSCRRRCPGIITGVVLALARIAGETAPLLFTAFNNRFFTTSLTQPISSLTVQVFTYAISPVRGLAPPGVGRRARARDDRAALLAPRARRHPPPRADASRQ